MLDVGHGQIRRARAQKDRRSLHGLVPAALRVADEVRAVRKVRGEGVLRPVGRDFYRRAADDLAESV